MAEKIYLHFLILCGILCQGIIASLAGKDTRESSEVLVRKRRVINHLPGGLTPTRIETANYLVTIKENNRAHCAGAILSHHTVLTAAICVRLHVSQYAVLSGSGYPQRSAVHNVTSSKKYDGNPPHQQYDGIALITVDPPFVYKRTCSNILLHQGYLAAGTEVTVRGWGYYYPLRRGPEAQRRLRTINLPIMNHTECQHVYRTYLVITEKHICTYHEDQYCAHSDAGTPLVFNNKIAGIYVYKGDFPDQKNPDVFIDVQRPEYSAWIRENVAP